MQIYGYPGERVDFVSKSASAGAIFFGDAREQVEEFFGPAHTATDNEVTYFSSSIILRFADDKVREIVIRPTKSQRERVDVFVGKQQLSGASDEDIDALLSDAPSNLSITKDEELTEVIFR
ncbi:hypothetical protein [Corynebacterium camporealensis]